MTAYATVAQLHQHGISSAKLPSSLSDDDKLAAITAASRRADSYLTSRFVLPLAVWGDDLTAAVCQIAAYELVAARVGFNPEDAGNMVLVDRKNDAIRWLEQISRGQVTPVGVTDSSTASPSGVPSARVFSKPPRGWY